MSIRARDLIMGGVEELRHEPTEKRVRALLADRVVADSARAVLVWEPRRVVPSYAVPERDVSGELVPAAAEGPDAPAPPILHPGIPFSVHSTAGEALDVRVDGATLAGAAFRPADPDLAGHVILDFQAFDEWLEEDEALVGHPRDPFHRVDIRPSSRHVRVELDGALLAESSRPTIVFETNLPTRFYLPREDVRQELQPSARRTYCAYKGEASYWSAATGGGLGWSYENPLREAAALRGLVAFFDERVDVFLDGERRERPLTHFARAILDEAGV
jgi:uncharacterized protein (DUF427 family)